MRNNMETAVERPFGQSPAEEIVRDWSKENRIKLPSKDKKTFCSYLEKLPELEVPAKSCLKNNRSMEIIKYRINPKNAG